MLIKPGIVVQLDCVLICTAGRRWNTSLSRSQTFSPKSKTTPTTRRAYSSTSHLSSPEARGTRGANMWARERVKAHTRRCREQITRQSIQRITRGHDTTADYLFDVQLAADKLNVADKLLIGELTVDTMLVGSSSTPKSSPASFSDVSASWLFSQLLFFEIVLFRIISFSFCNISWDKGLNS